MSLGSASRLIRQRSPAQLLAVGGITTLTCLTLYHTSNNNSLLHSASAETPPQPQTFNRKIGFTKLRLESSQDVNHDTKRLRFVLPEGEDAVSGLKLTSALLSFTFPGGSWFPTVRPYTPVSDLDQKGSIDFLIKHYKDGKASGVFHSLKQGDEVTFFNRGISSYKWTPNAHKHILLIAGGAGITPCLQLTRGILSPPASAPTGASDETAITLIWGVNTSADLFLKPELDALARAHPGRLRVVYTVSDGGVGAELEGEGVRKGRVGEELLGEVVGGKEGAADLRVFLCGPPAMEEAVAGKRGVLAALGVEKGRVVKF